MAKVTLDTNDKGATAASLPITTQTVVSLFIVDKLGPNNNYRIGLEVSPDGETTWMELKESITGLGVKTFPLPVCTNVQAKVLKSEGKASTVDIHLLAR